jgi:hypothetical protein
MAAAETPVDSSPSESSVAANGTRQIPPMAASSTLASRLDPVLEDAVAVGAAPAIVAAVVDRERIRYR